MQTREIRHLQALIRDKFRDTLKGGHQTGAKGVGKLPEESPELRSVAFIGHLCFLGGLAIGKRESGRAHYGCARFLTG